MALESRDYSLSVKNANFSGLGQRFDYEGQTHESRHRPRDVFMKRSAPTLGRFQNTSRGTLADHVMCLEPTERLREAFHEHITWSVSRSMGLPSYCLTGLPQ